jgi:tetratricopeptide (TPR) repeat protein
MATSAETLAHAQRLQQAGYFSRAEPLYREVLEAHPTNADVCFLLGENLFRQGKLDDAVDQFQRCIELSPYSGVADLHLSHVLHRQGKTEAAAACLRQCLQRLPQFPEAHYNQGNNLAGLGQLQDAVHHYQEAIRLRPDFAEAHNNLASTLLLLEEADQAIEHLLAAIRLRPQYTEAHCNLGHAYRDKNRLADAVPSYERALELQPDYGPAQNGLGEALLEQGDREGAERHFRRALHNNPFVSRTLLNLASHGMYTAADPAVDALKRWLTDPRLPVDFAIQLHFTLGKLLDRLELWDEAFHHFAEGNALRRSLFHKSGRGFDADAHARLIDRMIAFFTPEYFRRVQGCGVPSELPVFIVGMPRSGTTLVEQILSHHPKVCGAGELPDIGRIVVGLPAQLGSEQSYPECLSQFDAARARPMAETYLQRITALGGSAERVTDKMMELSLHLGFVATLFPRARVIWCRRDARDVCLSCFFQYFRGLNFTWDLEDLGRYYRERERLMAHWRDVLPLPIMEVVYEDLVGHQEGVSRRMLEFCGLAWDERCLKFHENPRPVKTSSVLQVRQPMYTTSVGRWRPYAAHLKPLLDALGVAESDPARP